MDDHVGTDPGHRPEHAVTVGDIEPFASRPEDLLVGEHLDELPSELPVGPGDEHPSHAGRTQDPLGTATAYKSPQDGPGTAAGLERQ